MQAREVGRTAAGHGDAVKVDRLARGLKPLTRCGPATARWRPQPHGHIVPLEHKGGTVPRVPEGYTSGALVFSPSTKQLDVFTRSTTVTNEGA